MARSNNMTSERDRKALEQIGQVDLDKVTGIANERETNIMEAFDTLEEKADNDELSDWEYDFYESVNNWFTEHRTLSDKQYEKLLQIKIKYE